MAHEDEDPFPGDGARQERGCPRDVGRLLPADEAADRPAAPRQSGVLLRLLRGDQNRCDPHSDEHALEDLRLPPCAEGLGGAPGNRQPAAANVLQRQQSGAGLGQDRAVPANNIVGERKRPETGRNLR